jgi:type IV pilus assembly protein PilN
MAKLNLLPWREERRKEQQRQFTGLLGAALLVGLGLIALVYLYYSGQIKGQNQRNELLRQEITLLDVKIKEIEELDRRKEGLLSRKRVIEELQGKRYEMVSLFTALAKTIADGAQVTTINQTGADLTINGKSQSSARVSSYMRNITSSSFFSAPDLTVIESRGGDRALPYEFVLTTKIKPAATDADGNVVNATDIPPGTGTIPTMGGAQ